MRLNDYISGRVWSGGSCTYNLADRILKAVLKLDRARSFVPKEIDAVLEDRGREIIHRTDRVVNVIEERLL